MPIGDTFHRNISEFSVVSELACNNSEKLGKTWELIVAKSERIKPKWEKCANMFDNDESRREIATHF